MIYYMELTHVIMETEIGRSIVETQESAEDLGSQWYSSSPSPSLKAAKRQDKMS